MLANRVIKTAIKRTSNNLIFQGGDNYVSQDGSDLILNDKAISFGLTVKTDNAGTSNNDQFTPPTLSGGTYDCTVYWGDGTSDYITTWNDAAWTHTYPSAGTYNITITGAVSGWRFANGGDVDKVISVSHWGRLDFSGTLGGAFFGANFMTSITATDIPKFLDNPTSDEFVSFFFNCNALTTIANIEQWTAPNAALRTNMFLNCNNFNQDVTNLITSNVTNITNMLRNCTIFDQDLSGADFSGVTSAVSFMDGTTISTANYDALLISLASQSLQTGVNIHFGNATYSAGAAATARANIISTYSWTITDGGPA